MQKVLILFVFLLWPVAAIADEFSLLQLHHVCTDTDARSQSACSGFLAGYIAGLQMGVATAKQGKLICFPNNFSFDQIKLIIEKLLRDEPQVVNLPAHQVLTVALQHAIPCAHSK